MYGMIRQAETSTDNEIINSQVIGLQNTFSMLSEDIDLPCGIYA
jgi:hypothetical protein